MLTSVPQVAGAEGDERAGTVVVAVRGAVDRDHAPMLRDLLAEAIDQPDRRGVVLDLSAAGAVDRAGLSVLLQSQDRAFCRGVGLCLAEPSEAFRSSLRLLRADAMFPMVGCRSAAADLLHEPRSHRRVAAG